VLTAKERIIYQSVSPEYRTFLQDYIGLLYLARLGEHERYFFWTLNDTQISYYKANFHLSDKGYPSDKDSLPRAKLAYDKVQKMVEQREALVISDPVAASPADTLTSKLKEMDSYIKSYKQAYFLGTSDQETWTGNFEVTPVTSPFPQGLFTYSERGGICSITSGIGVKGLQVTPKFIAKTGACSEPKSVIVQLVAPNRQLSTNVAQANFDERGERGFYYRVPAKASVRLCERALAAGANTCDGGDELGRDELAIAQLGQIASLPASTGGRRSSYKLVYYDSTGAIQTFNMASDALVQKSNLEDIGSAATELRDAKTARLKRETERLKAEKDKLDAQNALKKAREENANSNANSNDNQ
jgi:hypothetical protein